MEQASFAVRCTTQRQHVDAIGIQVGISNFAYLQDSVVDHPFREYAQVPDPCLGRGHVRQVFGPADRQIQRERMVERRQRERLERQYEHNRELLPLNAVHHVMRVRMGRCEPPGDIAEPRELVGVGSGTDRPAAQNRNFLRGPDVGRKWCDWKCSHRRSHFPSSSSSSIRR